MKLSPFDLQSQQDFIKKNIYIIILNLWATFFTK